MDTLTLPVPVSLPRAAEQDAAWRSLHSYGIYRVVLTLLLAAAYWGFPGLIFIGGELPWLASSSLIGYFVLSVILLSFSRARAPSLALQLAIQVLIDAVAITLLMNASGGIRSGLGILLLVTLAAAGLVSRGRMVYFHASIAAIAILFEQTAQVLRYGSAVADYFQTGLLAVGYFAIAGLASTLAQYARGAERIAEERGVDLANLAQINELVIRDMQDGFLVVDEKGVIRQHNVQIEALAGPLHGAAKLADYAPRLAVFLEEWRRDTDRVFPVVHDNRTFKDYQVRFVAIGRGMHGGRPAPTVIFLEDVSRIRAQAQQMKLVALGRLTASIAHEIRNPLSSITHASELLEEESNRSEGDYRLLRIIRDNAHRLDRMVQEVLYLNRRDRAHPDPIDGAVYLKQFVHDFCGDQKVSQDAFRIDLTAGRRLLFDRAHLNQVLWNLSRNAWRHCRREAGSILLALKPGSQENTLQLDVIDDGPGVPISALPHLFEPFFTTDAQGTGLGLYIARELAEVNGARLDYIPAESGAKFRLVTRGA